MSWMRTIAHGRRSLGALAVRSTIASAVLCAALAGATAGCAPDAQVATTREVVHLHGDAYARGLQHGTVLRDKVRAFYTKLLGVALLPNLNREQPSISGFLVQYQSEKYQNGRFSYEVLLEMALSIEPKLTDAVRDELRGISDGSGLSYEEVLILNTFADTVLAVRAIAATLRLSHGPRLASVQFIGKLKADGTQQKPIEYVPLPYAVTTAVPIDSALKLRITDAEGVAVETLRINLGETLFLHDSPGVSIETIAGVGVDVTIVPPKGLPAATQVGVLLNVADIVSAEIPPPAHLRFGRDEGFTFTTVGDPRLAKEVANIAPDDGLTRPPPVIVGLRGDSAVGGGPLLAQHFALLDAGAAHETTVLLVHHLDNGGVFATVGWAGMAWGFSGMNAAGLGYACNFSDTLDNAILKDLLPVVSNLPSATLTATGWPVGLAMRQVLENDATVAAATARLSGMQHVMGWVCGVADKEGAMAGIELDGDALLLPSTTVNGLHVIPGNGVD